MKKVDKPVIVPPLTPPAPAESQLAQELRRRLASRPPAGPAAEGDATKAAAALEATFGAISEEEQFKRVMADASAWSGVGGGGGSILPR